jgi:hypothetical protein
MHGDSPRSLDLRAALALAPIALGLYANYGEHLSYERLKRQFRRALVRDPIDSLLATVLIGSYLFWVAERDANPKCSTYLDALVFISTSLSVGYDDVFARTDAGKAITTFMQTFGPALTSSALERRADAMEEHLEVSQEMLDRLDAILEALRQRPQQQL